MSPLSTTPYCISLCNGIRLINNTTFQPGGGVTAIYLPHRDMPPIRAYFLAFKCKTGCLLSSLTLKQGVKFVHVLSPQTRIHIHSTVWHPPIGFNLLFLKDNLLHVTKIGCHHRQHVMLVANRNKRLVASYPGAFVLAQDLHEENGSFFFIASLICFYCFSEVMVILVLMFSTYL